MRLMLTLLLIFVTSVAIAKDLPPPPDCNIKPTQAVTTPAPVNMQQLLADLNALTTQDGRKIVNLERAKPAIQATFNTAHPNSKLQQFYRLLYVIAQNSLVDIGMHVDFDLAGVRKILVTSRVFTDPTFPSHITAIQLESTENIPQYTVSFSEPVRFPLNQGRGFKSWDNGYCQHAKELVFDKQFTFKMKEVRGGNLKVYGFQGVDMFGNFGNRGAVDVDLNYVRLAEVEFVNNSNLGRVKAYISKREFAENKHNALLRLVSQIVPNNSLQAIDW